MNIIHAGIILSAYLFIIIICYAILTGPVTTIITAFKDVNLSSSDSYVESAVPNIMIIYDLVFAGMGIVPIIWFIVWTFSREPDWRYK